MMLDWLLTLEGGVLLWIQEHLRTAVMDKIVTAFTSLGNAGILFIAVGIILLCFKKTRRLGVTTLVALIVGALCTNVVLKPLVARPRPWTQVEGLLPLLTEHDYSFPSGHTTAAFAFASGVCFAPSKKWMKWTAMAVALLMCLSRLYVGVHYPTDVIGGVVIGLLAGWLANLVVRTLLKKKRI